MKTRKFFHVGIVLGLGAAFAACGGSSENGDSSGGLSSGGTVGSAGAAGAAGSAGQAGSGGSGQAGSSGSGGSAGGSLRASASSSRRKCALWARTQLPGASSTC